MMKRGMSRDPSDEEDLRKVEEYLAGESRAFEYLFGKYREKVYTVAFRFVHNKEDALEITQEVFLRVHQGLGSFKTDSKFFTWIYRITVNRAIDLVRSRKSRRTVPLEGAVEGGRPLGEVLPDPQSSNPSDLLVRKELSESLFNAVESLSAKHRMVFVLHAIENLSYKEIAEVVGCTLGTVMSRLFYARRKLQQILADAGTVKR